MKIRAIFVILYLLFSISWFYLCKELYINHTFHFVKDAFLFLVIGSLIFHGIKCYIQLRSSKETENRLTTLINSMVDFVSFKDGEGRWIEANTFGLKLFELEHIEYRGKKDSELAEHTSFFKESLLYCEISDEAAWQNGTITRCIENIPLRDGTEKIFDSIKVPIFHDNGERNGLLVIGRDITDMKKAEEQLLKNEKLSIVGELAASVGHEIRNPLTSLKGFVQMLRQDSTEQQKHLYYDIMLNELERINHIVGELLLLAKPQKIHFHKKSVNTIIHDVLSLLESQANMHSIKLEFAEKEQLQLECSENQLKQLFINIIKNAIEASQEKGKIKIVLNRIDEDHAIIQVEDNGVGISKSFLNRLGEPFYSSKEKGTGLGLTVSMKIVDQHKGTMRFKSEENKGTMVEIVLPLKHEE